MSCRLADIIDSYERQLCAQRREMSLAGSECGPHTPPPRPHTGADPDLSPSAVSDALLGEATPNFKAFIKVSGITSSQGWD